MTASSRSRASGSTVTGRRASNAMRSMIGSSSESVILDSIPTFAKALAGALDSHLQRRHTRPRQCRHFLVAQLFDVLQEKSFPQQRVQFVQYSLHELLVFARPIRP